MFESLFAELVAVGNRKNGNVKCFSFGFISMLQMQLSDIMYHNGNDENRRIY